MKKKGCLLITITTLNKNTELSANNNKTFVRFSHGSYLHTKGHMLFWPTGCVISNDLEVWRTQHVRVESFSDATDVLKNKKLDPNDILSHLLPTYLFNYSRVII